MLAVLTVVLVSSAMQLTDGACPSGWDSLGPGCYMFTTSSTMADMMSYSEASSSCNSIGGKLIVFNSDDERGLVGNSLYVHQYISGIFGGDFYFWVGCTDEAVEGTFMCEDGTQLDSNSGLWRTGYPKSAAPGGSTQYNCVDYHPNTALEDYDCGFVSFALCEVEPMLNATTTQYPTTQIPLQTTTKSLATRASQRPAARFKSSAFSLAKNNEGRTLIGYCLTDHVKKTVQMVSQIECAMICNGEVGCKSFNYKGQVCELNGESKGSVGSSYFSQSDGCIYMD